MVVPSIFVIEGTCEYADKLMSHVFSHELV